MTDRFIQMTWFCKRMKVGMIMMLISLEFGLMIEV